MFQGNWKCSSCGGAITELPFQPRSEAGLTCRACYAKSKGTSARPAAGAPTNTPDLVSDEDTRDVPDFADLDTPADAPMSDDGFGAAVPAGEKPRFSGDWSCAHCGAAITSLPFSPRDTSNLMCIDCFKRSKA